MIMDRNVQSCGFIYLRRDAAIERRRVVKVRSHGITGSMHVIRAHKKSNRSRKLPREMGVDIKISQMDLLPQSVGRGVGARIWIEWRCEETAKDVLSTMRDGRRCGP